MLPLPIKENQMCFLQAACPRSAHVHTHTHTFWQVLPLQITSLMGSFATDKPIKKTIQHFPPCDTGVLQDVTSCLHARWRWPSGCICHGYPAGSCHLKVVSLSLPLEACHWREVVANLAVSRNPRVNGNGVNCTYGSFSRFCCRVFIWFGSWCLVLECEPRLLYSLIASTRCSLFAGCVFLCCSVEIDEIFGNLAAVEVGSILCTKRRILFSPWL